MRGYTFSVSCPDGSEYHERLKKAFPNLSSKIMDYLTSELQKQENDIKVKELREKWLLINPCPVLRRVIGNGDPFDYDNNKVVELLRQHEIIVTNEEAGRLINKLQNEWVDKYG